MLLKIIEGMKNFSKNSSKVDRNGFKSASMYGKHHTNK